MKKNNLIAIAVILMSFSFKVCAMQPENSQSTSWLTNLIATYITPIKNKIAESISNWSSNALTQQVEDESSPQIKEIMKTSANQIKNWVAQANARIMEPLYKEIDNNQKNPDDLAKIKSLIDAKLKKQAAIAILENRINTYLDFIQKNINLLIFVPLIQQSITTTTQKNILRPLQRKILAQESKNITAQNIIIQKHKELTNAANEVVQQFYAIIDADRDYKNNTDSRATEINAIKTIINERFKKEASIAVQENKAITTFMASIKNSAPDIIKDIIAENTMSEKTKDLLEEANKKLAKDFATERLLLQK